MPNIKHIPVCPYYQGEGSRSIKCEDTNHTFGLEKKRQKWTEKYCDADWEACKYARAISEAYDRYLEGDVMALKNQKIQALEKERANIISKLGKAEKKNAALIEQKKELYRQLRETKTELEAVNKDIYQKLLAIAQLYEDRMAYLIDTKCDGKLKESDVAKWAEGKEYALTFDDKAKDRTWTVVTKEAEENGIHEANNGTGSDQNG